MKTYINRLAIALLFLSACKVSKDAELPKPPLPATYRNAAVTADTTSIASMPWKSFFAEPTLQRLIDNAIAKNYDLQLAIKNIQASQLVLKQVKWNYVPTVGAEITASTDRPSNNSLDGLSLAAYNIGTTHIEDYSADVYLSWEADIWGKIRNQSKSALAAYLQTIEARKAIQAELVANVSEDYYNLLMLDAQLAIARSNVKLNDSTLRIIKLQYDAGQVTLLAIQQAQAQLLEAAQLVPQFEQNIAVQEDALRVLSGDLPDAVERNATLEQISVPDGLSAGLPATMVSLRPDVQNAELALVMANANVGITRADMYPAFRITASGGLNSYLANNWFNIPGSLFGMVGASLVEPLLQNKQLSTAYQIAQVNRDKTIIQFKQTVLNAVGEVSDALVRINKLKEQHGIVAERVTTLQHATTNANLLFKNGLATYLEVITAQSNVLQGELELASIKKAELNAVTDLYRSLGGGWK